MYIDVCIYVYIYTYIYMHVYIHMYIPAFAVAEAAVAEANECRVATKTVYMCVYQPCSNQNRIYVCVSYMSSYKHVCA